MKFRPLHDRVLIKVLDSEEKTAGGIIIPDTAKEKVLAIGDNLRTDIKGANNLNLDCIFITNGVHRDELNKISDLTNLLKTYNVKIDFFQKELTW